MNYTKPPLTIDKQIILLKQRGLVIDDEEVAKKYLKNISYYHLSSYFKSFQKNNDEFIVGTKFEDVLNIYVFDQKLRLLLLDVLERIEKSFKCRMAYELAIKNDNSHWILDQDLFIGQSQYEQFIVPCLKEVKNSQESCVIHYNKSYINPKYPPIWIIIEILSFGSCVKVYRQLKTSEQKTIARSYGIEEKYIINWIQTLSRIRNICAHHSRLWNTNINRKLNQSHKTYKHFFYNTHTKKSSYSPIFDYLVVLQTILCKVYAESKWDQRLDDIITEHKINISHMGFPDDWRERLQKIREIKFNK